MMELDISNELEERFQAVLRHCALEGAVRVSYSMAISTDGSKAALKYYDGVGKPIGDDRDYDILKSCFGRLETLFNQLIEVEVANNNMSLTELAIDLDLISGQMSVSGQ